MLVTPKDESWTAYQGSTSWLRRVLDANQSQWSDYTDRTAQGAAISEFRHYAMQWY
ncbi:hypothetical protein [Rubripirellula tenax]|uniref:hypothetical protein n=1 Tax=Rubripirellula tenax TaxID=2528015 RepID=UPI001C973FA1|nr:hypothetical protein [Rubripirellula tenax]